LNIVSALLPIIPHRPPMKEARILKSTEAGQLAKNRCVTRLAKQNAELRATLKSLKQPVIMITGKVQ
jgi:hypothetical protein